MNVTNLQGVQDMKYKSKHSLWAVCALTLLLQLPVANASEFIDNIPELKPDADRTGAMIWVKPGVNRTDYKQVMIEPMKIFISPNSEYRGLDPNELSTLSNKFVESMTYTLEPEVPVLNKGGPGVLYIRPALVNLTMKKKERSLLGYTPIGLVAGAVSGPSVSLKNAVLEIELLDAASGERVGVIIDKAPVMDDGELSWDSITKVFDFYGLRFKKAIHATK